MEYSREIRIRCPADRVFAFMDDVDREPEWQPNLLEASKAPPGPTAVGTRKSYVSSFLGKRIRNTYVTRVFDPNRRIVYETTGDSVLKGTIEIRFEERGVETLVSMAFRGSVTGPLRFVPSGMLEKASMSELEATLRRLKAKLEG